MDTSYVDFSRSGHKLIVDVVIFTTSENYIITACRLVYATARPLKFSLICIKFCPSYDNQVVTIQKILNISVCLSSRIIAFLTMLY